MYSINIVMFNYLENTLYIRALNKLKSWLYRGFVRWQIKFYKKDEAEFNGVGFVMVIFFLVLLVPVFSLSLYFDLDSTQDLILILAAVGISWIPTNFDKNY